CLTLCNPMDCSTPRLPRNQRSNCQHSLDHQKTKRIPEKHLLLTGHGKTDWFHIGKGVHQGCIFCHTAYLTYMQKTKSDSGSGWPSFHDVINSDAVTFTDDFSYGMHRVETSCSQYCINSASLSFTPAESSGAQGVSAGGSPAPSDKTEL
ncbi:hypothetical protein FD754_021545, partial [Muntiacus muntjak]